MTRQLKKRLPLPTAGRESGIPLDASLIEAFVREYLWHRFDTPQTIPPFHQELWTQWCTASPYVVDAAPRGHAKTTAGTHSFTLAATLFGFRDYVWLVSATEAQAISFLGDIRTELIENEPLIEAFAIHGLSKDNEAEVICHSGERIFKIIAKGAEQKIRGTRWRNKRPNLIVCDDMEEDEQVINPDRREKLRRWFLNALIPAGSDDCLVRVLGTVLHLDSLLERLLHDPLWLAHRYAAHASFDDFSNILWPEKFPAERLRQLRASFIHQGNASGYSQEYLNAPVAESDRFFRPEWFVDIPDEVWGQPMRFYSAIDFAISQKERADRTAIVTVGILDDGRMVFVDCRAGRWDALEIIEQMFEVHRTFHPELFIAEEGAIRKSLGPFVNVEMRRSGIYLNIIPRVPGKDKQARARSLQARFRAGGVLVDKNAEWYDDFYNEMTTFPRGAHDDRVDAAAWIGLELESLDPGPALGDMEEEDYAYEEFKNQLLSGRCATTGY